jgi:NhaA family Na+:H+ antiporter
MILGLPERASYIYWLAALAAGFFMRSGRPPILFRFLQSDATAGVLLLLCVAVSLLLANSAWGDQYAGFWQLSLPVGTVLPFTLSAWINDGLMAVFFLLVGLEIKGELLYGALSDRKKATLPVLAALGGAVLPAVIFGICNQGQPTAVGWGIPMATDIAFALGLLSLLGRRVPVSLKIFLAALAIADDLMAILVIALFYTSTLHWAYLIAAAAIAGFMFVCNRLKRSSLLLYLLPGMLLWYCVHHAGIHATIAGVITALLIPRSNDETAVAVRLEHNLKPLIQYLVMPLFALANTAIPLHADLWSHVSDPLSVGIIAGLILGKPLGITLLSWLAVKAGWGRLPEQADMKHILGIGLLGGVGFTMSIFIALLSFPDTALQAQARLAVLIASLLAGAAGYVVLYRTNAKGSVA